MLLTEAKKLVCPLSMSGTPRHCLGEACMAWKFHSMYNPIPEEQRTEEVLKKLGDQVYGRGYCGWEK